MGKTINAREEFIRDVSGSFMRAGCDSHGNPCWVIKYTAFMTPDDADIHFIDRFDTALARARKLGYKKYRSKGYGGGLIITTYDSPEELAAAIYDALY